MSRIESIFSDLRRREAKALMPFVCAGRPALESLPGLLRACQSSGASIVEVGVPFSDPIADGPVIAAAMHEALESGFRPSMLFEQVASVRDELDIGLVAMVSVSLVEGMGGPDRFVGMAKEAGFDGFIFPDAPLEESERLTKAARSAGLTASLLVAPTTPEDRMRRIVEACSGFVYLLARAGVTGEQEAAPEVEGPVSLLRRSTELPIACGFGISTADHVEAVCRHADAAIVGSALVRRLEEAAKSGQDAATVAEGFLTELAVGLISQPGAI